MNTETLVLIAIGAAIVFVPMIPWASILQRFRSDGESVSPIETNGPMGAVNALRYHFALRGPDVRDEAFTALDTLGSLVAEQPKLISPDDLE